MTDQNKETVAGTTAQVIHLKEGGTIKVDNVHVGFTIDGPAMIVVMKGEPAVVTTDPNLEYNSTTGLFRLKTESSCPQQES